MDLALCTASFAGQAAGYTGAAWEACEQATIDAFQGQQAIGAFRSLIETTKGLGLTHIELWHAHLDPRWAAPDQAALAKAAMDEAGVKPVGYTVSFTTPNMTKDDAEPYFQLARRLGAGLIVGALDASNTPLIRDLCHAHDLRMGVVNRAERSPDELLERLEPYRDRIGVAVDTGLFEAQGVDALIAVRALRPHLVHVRLKDVEGRGSLQTVTLGSGFVDVPEIVAFLVESAFDGAVAIEHSPLDCDPSDAIRMSVARVREWMLRAREDWM